MIPYEFAPHSDLLTSKYCFVWRNDVFSSEELYKITQLGDALQADTGMVSGGKVKDIRKCEVAWMENNPETEFIYSRLASVANSVNAECFDYDLYGFVEPFQYTVYAEEGAQYSWHLDTGVKNVAPRKLSVVLQLSSSLDYEGGDLEFMTSDTPVKARKVKGIVYVFPSFILHRVTPVTSGIRKSLVAWVSGKKFK